MAGTTAIFSKARAFVIICLIFLVYGLVCLFGYGPSVVTKTLDSYAISTNLITTEKDKVNHERESLFKVKGEPVAEELNRLSQEFQERCEPSQTLYLPEVSTKHEGRALVELLSRDYGQQTYGAVSGMSCPRVVRPATDLPPRRIGLFSYPGSGNTWTRHVLQQLTGLETGSLYHAYYLIENGFPGEGKVDNVLVVKSHAGKLKNLEKDFWDMVILLVRNPFDAIPGAYKGQAQLVEIDRNNTEWQKFAFNHVSRVWTDELRMALKFKAPYLFVHYEDLKECLLLQLVRMANFLRVPRLLESFSFCCAVKNNVGNFKRPETNPNVYLYSNEMIEELNANLKNMAQEVKTRFPELSQRLLDYRVFP